MKISEVDIKSTEYQELSQKIGSVFNSPAWLSIYGSDLKTYGLYDNGGKLTGFFNCYLDTRARFIRHLTNPPFAPHIGLCFENPSQNPAKRTAYAKSVLKSLSEFFSSLPAQVITLTLPPQHLDMQPFIWNNFKVVPHYTYRLPLTGLSEKQILQGFSPERRNDLKKAEKDGIHCEQSADYEIVRKMVEYTYSRKGKQLRSSLLSNILDRFPKENSYAWVSYQDEQPIAAAFVVYDHTTAYYLLGGYNPDRKHQGAGALAVHNALLHARKLNLSVFDFEGSMLPEVERYFRGFGGELTPLFTLNKATLPLEMILKLKNRSLF